MKTLTLLFLLPLISLIDIHAQISTNNAYSTDVTLTDNYSNKNSLLMPSIGKSWKYPIITERLLKNILLKINNLKKDKANYQVKLNDLNHPLTERQKNNMVNEVVEIEHRLKELAITIEDIERIGNDKTHIYNLGNDRSNNGAHYITKVNDTEIQIQRSNDGMLIHEFRHLSLSLQSKNGLRFSRSNLLMPVFADGRTDELQAYRAQYAFAPYSLPGFYPKRYEQVNLSYLGSILLDNGSVAYPTIHNTFEEDAIIAKSKLKTNKKDSSQTLVTMKTKKVNNNSPILGPKVKE